MHGKFELFKWERSETLKPAQHWCCSTSYSLSLIHNLSNTRILCSLPNLPAKHKFCDFLPDDLGFSSHSKKCLVAQKLWYPKHFFFLMRHKELTLKVKSGILYLVFFLFATEKLFSYFLFSIVKKSLYPSWTKICHVIIIHFLFLYSHKKISTIVKKNFYLSIKMIFSRFLFSNIQKVWVLQPKNNRNFCYLPWVRNLHVLALTEECM